MARFLPFKNLNYARGHYSHLFLRNASPSRRG